MTLFKNKRKNKERHAILYSIDTKIQEARKKKETYIYYALKAEEVDLVRSYCLSHYQALVEVDHKTENTIIYKIYGYSLD